MHGMTQKRCANARRSNDNFAAIESGKEFGDLHERDEHCGDAERRSPNAKIHSVEPASAIVAARICEQKENSDERGDARIERTAHKEICRAAKSKIKKKERNPVSMSETERSQRDRLHSENEKIGADWINDILRIAREPAMTPCPRRKRMMPQRLAELPDAKKMHWMIVTDRVITPQTTSQHQRDETENQCNTERVAKSFALGETRCAFAQIVDVDLRFDRLTSGNRARLF